MKNKILILTLIFSLPILTYGQLELIQRNRNKIRNLPADYNFDELNSIRNIVKQAEDINTEQFESINTIVPNVINANPGPFYVEEYLQRESIDSLTAFGYKIFNSAPSVFLPNMNLPAPRNYPVGPGDEIIITMWGETQLLHKVIVTKSGDIFVPNVGKINVNGLQLNELEKKLYTFLSKTYSSLKAEEGSNQKTYLDISTGKLRTVKVFVLGEVVKPGGYLLPPISSAFTALYYSGGPNINGTLRNIRIIRNGQVIKKIDLYDYLMRGDNSKDVKLENDDILFVEPVQKRAAISGEVKRSYIYELKENQTLSDLILFCGGLRNTAMFERIHIERIVPYDERANYENSYLHVDLKFNSVNKLLNSDFIVEDGDIINVFKINELPVNMVEIKGYVKNPGIYELKDQMTIKGLIENSGGVLKETFLDKALLIRYTENEKKKIITFSLSEVLNNNESENLILKNRDEIEIYNFKRFFPEKSVSVDGEVRNPGVYQRYQDMTLVDALILAGGLTDSATTKSIEVTRKDTVDENVIAKKFLMDLPRNYWNSTGSDFKLFDHDRILVKKDPNRNFAKTVTIKGEVKYPGVYSILNKDDRLTDLIERAGGFTNDSYKDGIYIVRENEIFEIFNTAGFTDSIETKSDLSKLIDEDEKINIEELPQYNKQKVIEEFSERLPVYWDKIKADISSSYNYKIQENDIMVIPPRVEEVYVVGEVGLPSTISYNEGKSLSHYIDQAGGFTPNSAEDNVIVINPNGSKWQGSGFFLTPDPEIKAGSLVIVPSVIKVESDIWPTIRDVVSVLSGAAVLILSITNIK